MDKDESKGGRVTPQWDVQIGQTVKVDAIKNEEFTISHATENELILVPVRKQ